MRRINYRMLLVVLVYVARAYGDFYPIACIGGCGDLSPALIRGREAAEGKYATGYHAINVENVKVVSQDLKMVFRAPGKIEVTSEYVMDVSEDNVAFDVRYIFHTCEYFVEGSRLFIKAIDEFEVELDGRRIKPEKISYFGIDPEPGKGGEYTAVFPLKFGRADRYKVKLSYSQEVPGGFLGVRDAGDRRGCSYGFSYDISPLRYWAGGIEDVGVELVVDGFNIADFGSIYPSAFEFTPEGCKWEWQGITDDMLSGPFDVKLYFGKAGGLGGDFTEVLREGGMEVYSSPGPNAKVISTLEQGERVYLYVDTDDPEFGDAMYERGWRKCRLLDNTEGFVITWLPEYFFDSFERRKMMGSFPGIYGGGNP
jgi:hypothetical protein